MFTIDKYNLVCNHIITVMGYRLQTDDKIMAIVKLNILSEEVHSQLSNQYLTLTLHSTKETSKNEYL